MNEIAFAAEDGGQAFGLAGADNVVDPRWVDLEHFPVEEENCAEGLALGGGRNVVVDGEVSEETVEAYGAARPSGVSPSLILGFGGLR